MFKVPQLVVMGLRHCGALKMLSKGLGMWLMLTSIKSLSGLSIAVYHLT